MKLKYQNYLLKNRYGFTLIETIFSLLIISLALSLIVITFSKINTDNLQGNYKNQFYNYIDIIESDDYKFELVECHEQNVRLHSRVENKDYLLNQYKDVIRLKSVSGGYMPLMLKINRAEWKIKDKRLVSIVKTGAKQFEAKIRLS